MIAAADLNHELLLELAKHASDLNLACHAAMANDRRGAERVLEAGALVAQLLGITAGVAGTNPPSIPLVEIDTDADRTLDTEADE